MWGILFRPIDFLGMDHDRLAIMFVFGAATGSILLLIQKGISGHRNAWEKGRNEFLLLFIHLMFSHWLASARVLQVVWSNTR